MDLEILQIIPKSPFFINGFWVFEFFHVFHIERDSIDLISICKPRYWSIFSYLPKASIYQICDPSNSQKPRFVEVE